MSEVKQRLADGWIQCRVIIEIIGKPKEYVEQVIRKRLEDIKKDKTVEVVSEKVADIIKKDMSNQDKLDLKEVWTTFLEMELMFDTPSSLTAFCFNYMPSLIEFIAPSKINFSAKDVSDFFNDLQARLHQVDFITKQLSNEVIFYKKNTYKLLKNFVTQILAAQARSLEELEKFSGVSSETMGKFLDELVDSKEVVLKGDLYELSKN